MTYNSTACDPVFIATVKSFIGNHPNTVVSISHLVFSNAVISNSNVDATLQTLSYVEIRYFIRVVLQEYGFDNATMLYNSIIGNLSAAIADNSFEQQLKHSNVSSFQFLTSISLISSSFVVDFVHSPSPTFLPSLAPTVAPTIIANAVINGATGFYQKFPVYAQVLFVAAFVIFIPLVALAICWIRLRRPSAAAQRKMNNYVADSQEVVERDYEIDTNMYVFL